MTPSAAIRATWTASPCRPAWSFQADYTQFDEASADARIDRLIELQEAYVQGKRVADEETKTLKKYAELMKSLKKLSEQCYETEKAAAEAEVQIRTLSHQLNDLEEDTRQPTCGGCRRGQRRLCRLRAQPVTTASRSDEHRRQRHQLRCQLSRRTCERESRCPSTSANQSTSRLCRDIPPAFFPMQPLLLSAKFFRYVCIGATATAFTHIAALVPVLRWGYVSASVIGLGWLAYILYSYWAAHTRHPIAWFEHSGDVLDLLGPTLSYRGIDWIRSVLRRTV